MRFNPKARLDTGRVSDGGRGGGGLGGGLGGGGMRLPIPGGAKAGGGIGGLLIIILIVIVNQLMGGGGGGNSGGAFDTSQVAAGDSERYANCKTGADANEDVDCARIGVENSLRDYWAGMFGSDFRPATMKTFSGSVSTGCGSATSQVGPFYCPVDSTIYMDTTFFDEVLEQQLGGPEGAFVEPYVLAHEYGHHIQNLLGTMNKVKTQQGPRSDAVRLELQADCYAGMWARSAPQTLDANGDQLISEITEQDAREAIKAAEAVGDDRIQKKTQGQVTEETWTHGSAESRVRWFKVGFSQGSLEACDTWAVDTP
jgi:predicted metalloprotease